MRTSWFIVIALALAVVGSITNVVVAPAPATPDPSPSALSPNLRSTGVVGSGAGLAIGDQVEVAASGLNSRLAPSVDSPVISVEPTWRQGITLAGSVLADGFSWWEVSWDDNVTGWSAAGDNGTVWIQNITGETVAFDRAAAVAYAAQYWGVVTSDGYFWNGPDSYVSYPQGTSVIGLDGDDCAHFVSQVIGDEPHQPGGGLDIPSRVPPTYGEPSAPDLGNMILDNGWGVQVNGTDQLEPGDVINYEWNPPDGTWDHIAVYLGNGEVAAHTDSDYGVNWTLGGAYAYRFIHILATTNGGSGIDHPNLTLSVTPPTGSSPLTVTATATASGGSMSYRSYLFDWGDGTSTTASTPSEQHTYLTPGNYTVTARVVDSVGASGWAANQTVSVTPAAPPPLDVSISASSVEGQAPFGVQFSATVTGGTESPSSFHWSFGDGTNATTTSSAIAHTYLAPGTFGALVTVEQGVQAATSSTVEITVDSPPPPPAALVASLTAPSTSGTAPWIATVDLQVSGGTAPFEASWVWGDGTTYEFAPLSGTVDVEQHTYTSPGAYAVTVVVEDSGGDVAHAVVNVTVGAPPTSPTAVPPSSDGGALGSLGTVLVIGSVMLLALGALTAAVVRKRRRGKPPELSPGFAAR